METQVHFLLSHCEKALVDMSKEKEKSRSMSDLETLSVKDTQSIGEAIDQLRDIKIDYKVDSGRRVSNYGLENKRKQSLQTSLTWTYDPALEKTKGMARCV